MTKVIESRNHSLTVRGQVNAARNLNGSKSQLREFEHLYEEIYLKHTNEFMPGHRHAGLDARFGQWQSLDLQPWYPDALYLARAVKKSLEIQQPIHIHDFGCGDARWGLEFSSLLAKATRQPLTYVGYDIQRISIQESQQAIQAHSDTVDAKVIQCNIAQANQLKERGLLDFSPNYFNIVLFKDVLHWLNVRDIENLLNKLNYTLPSSSDLFVSTCSVWNRTSIGTIMGKIGDDFRKYMNLFCHMEHVIYQNTHDTHTEGWTRFEKQLPYKHPLMTHYTYSGLNNTLEGAGFRVDHCEEINNLIFPNGHNRPDCRENIIAHCSKI